MRVVLRWIAPLLVAAGVAVGVAHATTNSSSVTWPATCELKTLTASKWACADAHLNALDSRQRTTAAQVVALSATVKKLTTRNAVLASCIAEYPISRYYDPNYYYYGSDSNNDGNFDQNNFVNNATNQLDQTHQGDNVDSWILRDSCGTAAFGRPPSP